MSDDGKKRGCFKVGCLGCLSISAIGIVALMLATGAQLLRDNSPSPVESARLDRELPEMPELDELIARGEIGTQSELPIDQGSRLRDSVFSSPELAGKIGRIELDLHLGEFEIVAGEPGQGVVVDGEYESDAFRLAEDFELQEDGSWTYKLSFRPRGGMFGMMFRGAGNNPNNRIKITLPPDRPFDLVGELGVGETALDLGGLWIRDLDLESGVGSHRVEFSRPTAYPMDSFSMEMSVGELEIEELGNASPRRVRVAHQIGEVNVDLSGAWQVDSEVTIRNRIGEARVEAPDEARLEVEAAEVLIGDPARRRVPEPPADLPEDAPTLKLVLEGQIGEVRIVD